MGALTSILKNSRKSDEIYPDKLKGNADHDLKKRFEPNAQTDGHKVFIMVFIHKHSYPISSILIVIYKNHV